MKKLIVLLILCYACTEAPETFPEDAGPMDSDGSTEADAALPPYESWLYKPCRGDFDCAGELKCYTGICSHGCGQDSQCEEGGTCLDFICEGP